MFHFVMRCAFVILTLTVILSTWGCYSRSASDPTATAALAARTRAATNSVARWRWGYIDHQGKQIIVGKYQSASRFYGGIASVALWSNGAQRCAVIEPTGQGLLPNVWPNDWIKPFFEGSAIAGKDSKHWGVIDAAGTWVVPPTYGDMRGFTEGLSAAAQVDAQGRVRWGYLDSRGQVAIPFTFVDAWTFLGGVAGVQLTEDPPTYALIDPRGQIVAKLGELKPDQRLYEGLICVTSRTDQGPRYGYCNRRGQLVIPVRFSYADRFSNGLAAVSDTVGGPEYYINHAGERAIAASFRSAVTFEEGVAVVEPLEANRPWCVIDTSGRVVLRPEHLAWAHSVFSEGLLLVREIRSDGERGLYGYMDHQGTLAIPPQYLNAHSFGEGLASALMAVDGDEEEH
jgi:hypothetical protein